MDFRYNRPIRIISLTVLFFFCWTFGGIFDIVAFAAVDSKQSTNSNQRSAISGQSTQPSTPKPEEKFQKAIDDITQIVNDTSTDTDTKKNKLKTRRSEITELDTAIKKQFSDTERFLKEKGLPPEILERHYKFVKHYEDNLKELNDNLAAIDKSKTKTEAAAAIDRAKAHLEKVKAPSKHVPLDPNKLPHRTAEPVWIEPRTFPEQFKESKELRAKGRGQKQILVASNGSLNGLLNSPIPDTQSPAPVLLALADPPTDADLAQTIEVQFTPAIQAKATELNHNPVKIYNWVRNNIEFVPTYGSIQGADMCLQTKQCNDFDTASLLIVLLRASGIYARYVYGTIELPIEKVKNWVGGFTDTNSAMTLIASGRIPLKGLTSGGEIVSAQMEHVWVEAYIPYGNYRGTTIDESIRTWIPMDGSYKKYEYIDDLDIAENISFDEPAYLSRFVDITPVEFYFQQIQAYLDSNLPGKTIEDVKRTKKIKEENLELLSPTLPYKAVVKLAILSVVPDSYRYKIGIGIPDLYGFGLTYQVSVPEIMGKRITISNVPSTTSDVQLINYYGGFYNVPAYLLKVKPAVKIDGTIVALGDEITVGTEQELDVNILYPGDSKTDRVVHQIKAGGYYALGIVPKGIRNDLIEQRFEKYKEVIIGDYPDPYNDALLGEVLNMTILRYFYNIDQSKSQFVEVSHYAYSKDISEGIAIGNIDVSYIYGAPYKIKPSTYSVDIQREMSLLLPIDGSNSKKIEIMSLLGMTSSVLENQTLEQMMSIDSISAIKAIQLANEKGIPIHRINESNVTTEIVTLNVSEEVKYAIRNTVNQGLFVTVPESDLQVNQWYGAAWIVENPATGAGAYMISGYLMGGETTKPIAAMSPNQNPSCDLVDALLFDDVYRAIAYKESKWSQFRQDGTTETSGSAYGIMQIERRTWKGSKWPGTTTPIDWDMVLNDWTYNFALGQSIYEWNLNNVVPKDLERAGIDTPTEEQKMLDALSRYNQYEPYYKEGDQGTRRSPCKGCDYADSVNKIKKEQTWTDRKKLRCN